MIRAAAVVSVCLFLSLTVPTEAQQVVYGDTIVEVLGLRSWSPVELEAAVRRYAPGVSLASGGCAVILRDSLGFADASVSSYVGLSADTVWVSVRVIEPRDSALIRYTMAGRAALPIPDRWEPLRRLAAETGDTLSGTHKGRAWSLTGPERALAYLLVLRTGIRRGELLGLVRGDFDLAGDTPTLRLDAERTKARKAAVFHLPKDLAERMREHLRHKATDAPAFSFGDPTKLAGIVRADLQRARDQWLEAAGADAEERIKREKSAFLAPKGVDLHTLRTTYISDLARAGVPLAQAMRLARHSTPHLTAAVYSRFGASDERSALDRLDALHAAPAAPERERATGTDGQPLRLVGDDGEVSGRPAGRFGGEESRRSEKNSASADASTPGGAEAQGEVNTGFAGESGRGGIRTRGTGLGPYAALAKRCLQPLGHPTK